MLQTNCYENIIQAQKGDKEKMASLVNENMGLVYTIAKRFQGRGYEQEDLNQIGALGLVKAIKKFDINYEVQLSTYAVPYILGEIKKYIRDDGKVKVSRSIKELAVKINNLKKEYLEKEGKEIKVEEIAEILHITKEEIAVAIDATSSSLVYSMNEKVFEGKDGSINVAETIASNKNEEMEITNRLAIQKVLNELDDREKQIIILRYYKGITQTEISKRLGISQVQISRIERNVLSKMRQKLA